MITTDFNEGGHTWEKTNLVTIQGKGGKGYDTYRCIYCGLTAKMYSFGELCVEDRSHKKLSRCISVNKISKIRITCCRANGIQFENLIPGSIHDIIAPPTGFDNSRGVWVMGVGEPVKVLFGEFEYVKE